MTLTKTQTTKLLTQLTGKEAFVVITQGFIERSLQQPPTFTDAEIDRMMEAVWNNPQRAQEFRQYREAKDVMDIAMYEGKLAIQKAITHILMQVMLTSQIAHDRKPPEEVTQWAEKNTRMMQRQHVSILHWLEWVQRWQMLLQAFDTVLSTRMGDMLSDDRKNLEMFITLYHDRMGWIEHDIIYAKVKLAEAAKASQDIIEALSAQYVAADEAWQLPTPEKAAADHPILQRCITYLSQCPSPDKPFRNVLEMAGV